MHSVCGLWGFLVHKGTLVWDATMTTEEPPAAPTPTGVVLPSHPMHSAITHTCIDHAKGNVHALVQGMKANSH